MKIAARILAVLAMLVSVLALTAATSSAATSKDDGYCIGSGDDDRILEEGGAYDSEGTLKHKYNKNKDQFDLKCKGQNPYLMPTNDNNGEFAYYVCGMMGFASDEGGYYFNRIPGKILSAKVKINANGKFSIKCKYDAFYEGPGCEDHGGEGIVPCDPR